MKVITFLISSICLLRMQSGLTANNAPRLLITSSVLNCSTPATIYPLINSCRGWNLCGFHSQSYSYSCGNDRCYNQTSKSCNIVINDRSKADSLYWFDCTSANVGRFMPWKQNPAVYGLCFQPNFVAFMNWCPLNTIFCPNVQECMLQC